MRKKFLAALLAMTMLLIPGCGKDSSNNDNVVNPSNKAEATTTADNDGKSDSKKEATDPTWAETSVFYEIFVRSFNDGNEDGIGDFKGIADKVSYLKELGVDAVWLMPIMESTTYHGYDVVDYYNTNPDYGTMDEFKDMLKVLHDNDIKVIIDFVVNHTSSENEWFKQALADKNSPYRNYYFIYDEYPQGMKDIRKNMKSGLYFYGHYDSIMPDLNYANQNVRDSIKDVAGFWLDAGVDGFRLDGAKEIDEDDNITHGWWKEFTQYVSQKNPAAFVVGENWNNTDKTIAPFYSDMNSSFNFPFASAIEDMAGGVTRDYVTELKNARKLYKEAADDKDSVNKYMIDSTMINNHDMDRIATRLKNIDEQKVAASLFMTMPGTPFIYYGDELGQLGQSPDQFRREPFDWYKSGTGKGQVDFKKAVGADPKFLVADDGISYEEECADDNSIFNYYKKLVAIRKENPILFTGDYETIGMNDGIYAYTVSGAEDGSTLLIVHNQRKDDKTFSLNVDGKNLLTGEDVNKTDSFKLAGYTSLILKYEGNDAPLNEEEFKHDDEDNFKATFNVTLPKGTPEDENIYITGTFNNWNECDDNYILTRTSATTAQITISNVAQGSIEYKFTRGSWTMREQNSEGADLIGPEQKQNRNYRFEKDDAQVDVTIEHWSDAK